MLIRQRPRRTARCGALLASVCLATPIATPAYAQKDPQAFPGRVVTLVNPFAPGASTDIVARLIAQKLTEHWSQPMIVENRPGASGTIGLAAVAKAPPDGHMLAMIIVSHASTVALHGNKAPVDLVRDFTPVTQLVSQPYVLIVNPSLPVKSVRDLIALANSRPGAVTYGSSGVGSVLHLAGEMLAAQTRTKFTHVPYKGAAPALSDVAGGHIVMVFSTRMSAQPLIASGRARAIAVTSTERVANAPDIPTMHESGLPGYEVNGWYGIGGPAGLPAAINDRLNQEINRVLKIPDVRERMIAEGTLPSGGSSAQFGELVRTEVEKWRRIIRQARIVPDTR